jgi:Fe-S oxidoreductase
MAAHLTQCPYCREAVPQVQLTRRTGPDGKAQMRRGLLYMLLAAVIYYFAAGYAAPLWLPVQVLPVVVNYLLPLLFLAGLGLTVYGLFLRFKS